MKICVKIAFQNGCHLGTYYLKTLYLAFNIRNGVMAFEYRCSAYNSKHNG